MFVSKTTNYIYSYFSLFLNPFTNYIYIYYMCTQLQVKNTNTITFHSCSIHSQTNL